MSDHGVCPCCGCDLSKLAKRVIDEHVRECTGVDPNATTAVIEVADAAPKRGERKDRRG